jgi:hypothetical protein
VTRIRINSSTIRGLLDIRSVEGSPGDWIVSRSDCQPITFEAGSIAEAVDRGLTLAHSLELPPKAKAEREIRREQMRTKRQAGGRIGGGPAKTTKPTIANAKVG